jgi:hypothetical protein
MFAGNSLKMSNFARNMSQQFRYDTNKCAKCMNLFITDMTSALRAHFMLFMERTQDQTPVFHTYKSISA